MLEAVRSRTGGVAGIRLFQARFPDAHRCEQSVVMRCPTFPAFRAWEEATTHDRNRDLLRPSLALADLDPVHPRLRYLRGATGRETLACVSLYLWWRLGAPWPFRQRAPLTGF